MKNSNTILASVQAFMDKMQDGDMRELVANLQAALEYKNEELRIGYTGRSSRRKRERNNRTSRMTIEEDWLERQVP